MNLLTGPSKCHNCFRAEGKVLGFKTQKGPEFEVQFCCIRFVKLDELFDLLMSLSLNFHV